MTNAPSNTPDQVKLIVHETVADETIQGEPPPGTDPFDEQARIPFFHRTTEKTASVATMSAEYTTIRQQVTQIFLSAEPPAGELRPGDQGFRLDELTVHLGVSAKGGIGFIAEVGVEASVELKFVRHS